jgi:3-deoxy-manno-octulosonate cytidylyltransferase (CMP-KDO synthetase)
MKRIGIIPARWQSTRFPGKPLADILGKSLVRRAYENASLSKNLDAIFIATDDKRIFDHAQTFGATVFMTSASCSSGTDRVWEVIKDHFDQAEIIVNVQGDEPCLNPHVIDQLVLKLDNESEAAVTTPVAKILDAKGVLSKDVVKCVFDQKERALYFSRSPIPFIQCQKTAPTYFRHLGIYCFRRKALQRYVELKKTPLQECEDLEQLKMLEHGFPIHVCIVEEQAVGVDTPEDLKTVVALLCQKENISLSLGA